MDDLRELELRRRLTVTVDWNLKRKSIEGEMPHDERVTILVKEILDLITSRDSKRDAYIIGSDVSQQERHRSDRYGDWCGDHEGVCICDDLNFVKTEQRKRAGDA